MLVHIVADYGHGDLAFFRSRAAHPDPPAGCRARPHARAPAFSTLRHADLEGARRNLARDVQSAIDSEPVVNARVEGAQGAGRPPGA